MYVNPANLNISRFIGIRIKRKWKNGYAGSNVKWEWKKPQIKGTFIEGTTHLKRSRNKGDNARSREYKNVKLIVALAILAAILWYFYLR